MNSILEVKNLHVSFPSNGNDLHAVRGIDFTLFQGESLGIVGESGCGKSAAIKALVQLLPPYTNLSGEILYKQEKLLSCSKSKIEQIRRKEIGMIFQDPMATLNPTMKAGNQIIESYREVFQEASKKDAVQAALLILTRLGIKDPADLMEAYPPSLSGGLRQRVMIALALIRQPHILLADEPTTAIDAVNRIQILETLKQQQKNLGLTIVLVTHDLSLAAHFCDRIIVMYAGKIVESASAADLFRAPQHPYTVGLINSVPRFNQDRNQPLKSIEGTPPNLNMPLLHCSFCSRCSCAMNICALEIPSLYPIGPSHWSACFKNDPGYPK